MGFQGDEEAALGSGAEASTVARGATRNGDGPGMAAPETKDAVEMQQTRQDKSQAGSPQPPPALEAAQPVDEEQELQELQEEQLEPFFQPYWSAKFAVTCLAAILIIWSFCWMYIGAFWNPLTRLKNLHVAVLNCDVVPPAASLNASFAPLLPLLTPVPLAASLLAASVYNSSSSLSRTLHWDTVTCPGAADSGSGQAVGCGPREAECVQSLYNDVLQGGPWALLYFPSNMTAAYLSWFAGSGVAPTRQPPLLSYVYGRGRCYSTYTYLSSVITSSLVPGASRGLVQGLAASPAVMAAGLSPEFLASGVGVQQVDLAPVHNFGQHFASYIFCVLLWLGASFVVVTSWQFKLHTEVAVLDPRVATARSVRLSHLAWAMLVKGVVAVLYMFVLMVLLACVLWALGRGTENWHLNAGQAIAFGWYMSWSFISINGVLLHVQGIERFSSSTALLLILQLTSASAILSTELSNRFFYIGKGLPFFYGVRGFRTIFFGTMTDKMWENWLVLTAYNVVFGPLGVLLVARKVWSNSHANPDNNNNNNNNNRVRPRQGRPAGTAAVGMAAMPVGFA